MGSLGLLGPHFLFPLTALAQINLKFLFLSHSLCQTLYARTCLSVVQMSDLCVS